MNKRLLLMVAAAGLCCSLGAQTQKARTITNAENGKAVRRITFDRERVSIIYADGSVEENVGQAAIRRSKATGIEDVAGAGAKAQADGAYSLDGRRVSPARTPKGIYIEKKNGEVRKTVRK